MTNPIFLSLVNGLSSCPHVPRSSPGSLCYLVQTSTLHTRQQVAPTPFSVNAPVTLQPGRRRASRACKQACALSCLPVAAFTLLSEVVLGKATSVFVQLKFFKHDATLTPKAWQPPSTSTLIVAAFLRRLPPAIHLSTSFILTFTIPFATSSMPCPIRYQC